MGAIRLRVYGIGYVGSMKWVAVQELKLSYEDNDTLQITACPSSGKPVYSKSFHRNPQKARKLHVMGDMDLCGFGFKSSGGDSIHA